VRAARIRFDGPPNEAPNEDCVNGDEMAVAVYLLLTVAIFAILSTVVKLAERL
jgi:hypothetical protein